LGQGQQYKEDGEAAGGTRDTRQWNSSSSTSGMTSSIPVITKFFTSPRR
jgi:hypothetical protein